VTLEFRAGGGRPPSHHEVLRVEPGGDAWYLTGLPWPEQPPFDEIGAYSVELGHELVERLAAAAAPVLDAPPGPPGPADSGLEVVRLDGRQADWSPAVRPPGAEAFVGAARAAIAAAREHPWSAVRGTLVDRSRVRLVGRGEHPLPVQAGELRAGWGRRTRPPSPLRLAERPPVEWPLPATLDPGVPVEAELGRPGEPQDDEFDAVYALVHLRWRAPAGNWLDGWLVAGGS
jgi:hypothetical protein